MSTCYLCGRTIPPESHHFRRKVKTGERVRREYSRPKPASVNTSFGMRLVCFRCAQYLDAEERRKRLPQYIELGIAIVLLLIVLLARLLGK